MHKALLTAHVLLPAVHHDFIVHLLHHVVDGIEANGPPWCTAMWPFEQLWGRLITQNHCNTKPAVSIMLNFRAQQLGLAVSDIAKTMAAE